MQYALLHLHPLYQQMFKYAKNLIGLLKYRSMQINYELISGFLD